MFRGHPAALTWHSSHRFRSWGRGSSAGEVTSPLQEAQGLGVSGRLRVPPASTEPLPPLARGRSAHRSVYPLSAPHLPHHQPRKVTTDTLGLVVTSSATSQEGKTVFAERDPL